MPSIAFAGRSSERSVNAVPYDWAVTDATLPVRTDVVMLEVVAPGNRSKPGSFITNAVVPSEAVSV